MKKLFVVILILLFSLFSHGCSAWNPRNNPKIENQNGKIEDIRTNQNGLMLELMKIRQQGEITNSNLKEIQNGIVNLNAVISKNENYGVQVLQGDGSLMLIFAITIIGMILYHYRTLAKKSEQAVKIMAKEIVKINDENLNDNILSSAKRFNVEKLILKKMQEEI